MLCPEERAHCLLAKAAPREERLGLFLSACIDYCISAPAPAQFTTGGIPGLPRETWPAVEAVCKAAASSTSTQSTCQQPRLAAAATAALRGALRMLLKAALSPPHAAGSTELGAVQYVSRLRLLHLLEAFAGTTPPPQSAAANAVAAEALPQTGRGAAAESDIQASSGCCEGCARRQLVADAIVEELLALEATLQLDKQHETLAWMEDGACLFAAALGQIIAGLHPRCIAAATASVGNSTKPCCGKEESTVLSHWKEGCIALASGPLVVVPIDNRKCAASPKLPPNPLLAELLKAAAQGTRDPKPPASSSPWAGVVWSATPAMLSLEVSQCAALEALAD
eukprot:gnl/TRDRNA2_/TRDRNA2_194437_c0_seq1.p1 gnl/TRDRNA2_/TRDRNA2_194437_c0~~gnl/TRDRNA2_/TRDRNA2_194437_c0_seq1.p1  ORF type:complete len:339 (+),score=74.43 gnl/TRDRNA2_/TRDRNA2_194437_c0_seq1:82-1098(+)